MIGKTELNVFLDEHGDFHEGNTMWLDGLNEKQREEKAKMKDMHGLDTFRDVGKLLREQGCDANGQETSSLLFMLC